VPQQAETISSGYQNICISALQKFFRPDIADNQPLEGKPKVNCGIIFSPWGSIISKIFTFFGRSPGFTLFFSLPNGSQISMGHWWIDSDRANTEGLGQTPVPRPLCPPQMPHGLAWDRNRTAATTVWRLTTWAKLMQIVFNTLELPHVEPNFCPLLIAIGERYFTI